VRISHCRTIITIKTKCLLYLNKQTVKCGQLYITVQTVQQFSHFSSVQVQHESDSRSADRTTESIIFFPAYSFLAFSCLAFLAPPIERRFLVFVTWSHRRSINLNFRFCAKHSSFCTRWIRRHYETICAESSSFTKPFYVVKLCKGGYSGK